MAHLVKVTGKCKLPGCNCRYYEESKDRALLYCGRCNHNRDYHLHMINAQ